MRGAAERRTGLPPCPASCPREQGVRGKILGGGRRVSGSFVAGGEFFSLLPAPWQGGVPGPHPEQSATVEPVAGGPSSVLHFQDGLGEWRSESRDLGKEEAVCTASCGDIFSSLLPCLPVAPSSFSARSAETVGTGLTVGSARRPPAPQRTPQRAGGGGQQRAATHGLHHPPCSWLGFWSLSVVGRPRSEVSPPA